MLKVKNLHKYYHNPGHKPLHVIDNTSLEIPETGIIAVIGESGAGKTTLINTISGLDSFKSGEIAFDDVSVKHYHSHIADKLRMKNYGFIFQNYYLLEKQTVYENVKVALDAFDISESEKKKRVNYVLNQLGIVKYTNKLVSNLSGGEQQRVSIARALVKSPRIIFADEPTGSLDEKTTFNVLNILKKVSQNCAVFIVTHEREIISYYADYIIELKEGVVVKEFTPVRPEGKTLAVDQNIYLSELEHLDHQENKSLSFDIYSDGSSPKPSNFKVAIKNNKIYLEASSDIVVLSKDSENHLVDGKRYEIKDYVNDDFNYQLEPLPYGNNKISLKEAFKKGFANFKTKRPIKRILQIICVLLSIFLLGVVEGVNTIQTTDLSSDLTVSKGNIYLAIEPNAAGMTSSKLDIAYQSLCQTIEYSSLPGEIMFEARDDLTFEYEGFYQMESQTFTLPGHDFKSLELFDKKTLTSGSVPTKDFEIVIDEYVLENMISSSLLKNIVTDYSYFVGKTLNSSREDYSLTISGVCRTKSPTIYGYKNINFFRLLYSTRLVVADIDYAKQFYPSLANISIEPGHCLKNYSYTDYTTYFVNDGYFDDLPYDMLINASDYYMLKQKAALDHNRMYIQTDGSQSTFNAYKKLIGDLTEELEKNDNVYVTISVENKYQEQADKALGVFKNILNYVEIMAFAFGVIALLMIILSTYLSMLNQISDIAVYRSLGYSKFHLGLIYFIELAMVAFIYTLVGFALTYFTLFVLDVIPIVPFAISTPFIEFLAFTFALASVITLIGLLPIMIVFRLTPAKIYNRYNRRINNI